MCTKEITVRFKDGLTAQSACFFIQKANEFNSQIWVEHKGHRVNAKSLLGIVSMGIVNEAAITLIAEGSDENEAVDALVRYCCGE